MFEPLGMQASRNLPSGVYPTDWGGPRPATDPDILIFGHPLQGVEGWHG